MCIALSIAFARLSLTFVFPRSVTTYAHLFCGSCLSAWPRLHFSLCATAGFLGARRPKVPPPPPPYCHKPSALLHAFGLLVVCNVHAWLSKGPNCCVSHENRLYSFHVPVGPAFFRAFSPAAIALYSFSGWYLLVSQFFLSLRLPLIWYRLLCLQGLPVFMTLLLLSLLNFQTLTKTETLITILESIGWLNNLHWAYKNMDMSDG